MRPEPVVRDLGLVRTLLRPRLLRRDTLPPRGAPVHRNLGADLVALLEVAGPQTSHWVAQADVAAWGVPTDELWSIALENLRQEDHQIGQQGLVTLVTGSSRYVASHALRLGELLAEPAPNGVLLAVPHPDLVLFLPVLGVDWVVVLRELPRIVESMYGGEFGALSPHIYWWADGVFEQVGVSEVDNKVTITGSERFTALMNRLLQEGVERFRQ